MKHLLLKYLSSVFISLILTAVFYKTAEITPGMETIRFMIGASLIPYLNLLLCLMLSSVFVLCLGAKLIYFIGGFFL